jgi:hypothetical protein
VLRRAAGLMRLQRIDFARGVAPNDGLCSEAGVPRKFCEKRKVWAFGLKPIV